MAQQTVKGGLVIPPPPVGIINAPTLATTQLIIDAASEAAGFIVRVPKTGNVRKVWWATRTVTTGATLDVRLETLDLGATPAVPSGTLWGTNTNGAQVVADANDNTSFATQLAADAAVTAGDALAVVIANPAASFGDMQISAQAFDTGQRMPYCLLRTASWAAVTGISPVLAFEYDDGSIEQVMGCRLVHSAIASNTVSTSTTPDVVGTRFQLPFPARARGCWVWIDADGPFAVKLVSADYHQGNNTGVLATTGTVENEVRRDVNACVQWLPFTATADLSAGTNYRLVVEPTSTTSLVVHDFDMPSLASMAASFGGADWHFTTAKDPTQDSDWTNYNSGTFRKFFAGLVLDGFSDGIGAGGGAPVVGSAIVRGLGRVA